MSSITRRKFGENRGKITHCLSSSSIVSKCLLVYWWRLSGNFRQYKFLPSVISRSRISQAKMVGFSRLYCSILETTAGVATFGLLPPIKPGGRNVPETKN